MTSRKIARLVLSAAAVAGFASNTIAVEQDVNAYIAKAPIAGVPAGPYGQWSEDQKKTAFKRVAGFCQFLCVDPKAQTYASPQAAEIATAEAKTCLGACVVSHLPLDFPRYNDLQAQLKSDYARAKQLGSRISWPLPGR
jgi:hypothetical protein